MGLEDVKDEIITEAKQEKKQILEEADEKKEEILDEAHTKAETIREDAEKEISEQKESIKKRTVSNANMKAKKQKLEAKQEELEKIFEDFRRGLQDLDEEEKESFVKNAVDSVGFEVGEIHGSEDFEEASSGYDFTAIDEEGIILVSSDGERQVNYTFDKIREDFQQDYRKKIADILFE